MYDLVAAALLAAQAESSPSIRMEKRDGTASTIQMAAPEANSSIDQAAALIKDGKPSEALPLLDAVISGMEMRHSSKNVLIFSARSLVEGILYGGMAGTQKKSSVVLDGTWSTAHFLKGFALIDLQRPDEAKVQFDKAIALAPMNALFLAERGEWHKNRKDWPKALADFEAASSAAEFSPDEVKKSEKARALRGMGFVKIEQGQLKEAERLFKQSLKLEPDSAHARSELEYIRSLKRN